MHIWSSSSQWPFVRANILPGKPGRPSRRRQIFPPFCNTNTLSHLRKWFEGKDINSYALPSLLGLVGEKGFFTDFSYNCGACGSPLSCGHIRTCPTFRCRLDSKLDSLNRDFLKNISFSRSHNPARTISANREIHACIYEMNMSTDNTDFRGGDKLYLCLDNGHWLGYIPEWQLLSITHRYCMSNPRTGSMKTYGCKMNRAFLALMKTAQCGVSFTADRCQGHTGVVRVPHRMRCPSRRLLCPPLGIIDIAVDILGCKCHSHTHSLCVNDKFAHYSSDTPECLHFGASQISDGPCCPESFLFLLDDPSDGTNLSPLVSALDACSRDSPLRYVIFAPDSAAVRSAVDMSSCAEVILTFESISADCPTVWRYHKKIPLSAYCLIVAQSVAYCRSCASSKHLFEESLLRDISKSFAVPPYFDAAAFGSLWTSVNTVTWPFSPPLSNSHLFFILDDKDRDLLRALGLHNKTLDSYISQMSESIFSFTVSFWGLYLPGLAFKPRRRKNASEILPS